MADEVSESNGKYGLVLPNDDTLTARFKHLVSYWAPRNRFILDMRDAEAGRNDIEAPISTQYKVKVLHAYSIATIIRQKVARYKHLPNIQVIPDDTLFPDSRQLSSQIEKAINVGLAEIERRTTGDVWDRVIHDQHLLDEGVEKWLRAPNAFWTELVAYEESAERRKENPDEMLEYPYLSEPDVREKYKATQGIPITRYYVPLERFFPQYDGNSLIEGFDVDDRTLLSVLNNPLFKANDYNGDALSMLQPRGRDGGSSQVVYIVEYINNNWHAYYLAGMASNSTEWPAILPNSAEFLGSLRLLYKYEHKLGRSLYNCVGGAGGGWKTTDNFIEAVGKGMLELSTAADNVFSQVHTNIRAKFWPSLKATLDPEKRGFGTDASKAKMPKIQEGEETILFTGEDITPIFLAQEDPMTMWHWDTIQGQLGKMGGADVLFGEKSPGVDNGYQQALQKTSAESTDEKLQQRASVGACSGAELFMLHAKALKEDISMVYAETIEDGPMKKRKTVGRIVLEQSMLIPLPMLDAQVRKPSPMDYLTALRAFQMATTPSGNMPPAMSFDTARSEILDMNAPDEEEMKVLVEGIKREIVTTGVISAKVGDMINIQLAQTGVPEMGPEQLAKADPAMVAAMMAGGPQAAASGGADPSMLASGAEVQSQQGGGGTLPPGPVPGNPESLNRVGEAASMNALTGVS